ncbi:hypothetical protein DMENIID0001_055510 [Sergentomyia squamirostris]
MKCLVIFVVIIGGAIIGSSTLSIDEEYQEECAAKDLLGVNCPADLINNFCCDPFFRCYCSPRNKDLSKKERIEKCTFHPTDLCRRRKGTENRYFTSNNARTKFVFKV